MWYKTNKDGIKSGIASFYFNFDYDVSQVNADLGCQLKAWNPNEQPFMLLTYQGSEEEFNRLVKPLNQRRMLIPIKANEAIIKSGIKSQDTVHNLFLIAIVGKDSINSFVNEVKQNKSKYFLDGEANTLAAMENFNSNVYDYADDQPASLSIFPKILLKGLKPEVVKPENRYFSDGESDVLIDAIRHDTGIIAEETPASNDITGSPTEESSKPEDSRSDTDTTEEMIASEGLELAGKLYAAIIKARDDYIEYSNSIWISVFHRHWDPGRKNAAIFADACNNVSLNDLIDKIIDHIINGPGNYNGHSFKTYLADRIINALSPQLGTNLIGASEAEVLACIDQFNLELEKKKITTESTSDVVLR